MNNKTYKVDWVDTDKNRYIEYFINCYVSYFQGKGIINPTLENFSDTIYRFGIKFTEDDSFLSGVDLAKMAINRVKLKRSKLYKISHMKKLDWLFKKYNTKAFTHVCFEAIYNYVTDVSTDEINDIEVFYRYITKKLDDIFNSVYSKANMGTDDPNLGVNAIHSVCRNLENIIDLPIDVEEWWSKKQKQINEGWS